MKTPTDKTETITIDQTETSERRRQFLKLSAMFTAMGALPLLQSYNQAMAAEPNAPLRIGYLPITDATALLVAHHNGLFQKQGIEVEKPLRYSRSDASPSGSMYSVCASRSRKRCTLSSSDGQ